MAKTTAAKGAGTAIAKYDAELAEMMQQGQKTANARAGAVTQSIGTKGGRFSIDGTTLKELTIDVVVVGSILHNRFYKGKFDPENPETPDCYAYGKDKEDMAPDLPNVPDRQVPKGSKCENCPNLEWGSAGGGSKGKACSETVKLVTIHADDVADGILKATERTLSVPPTSGAAFSTYTDEVAGELKLPVAAVISQVEIAPGKNGTGHQFFFATVQPLDKAVLGEVVQKHAKVMKTIDQDYPAKEASAKGNSGGRAQQSSKAAPAAGGRKTTTTRKY